MVSYGKVTNEVVKKLHDVVGPEFVSTDREDLYIYSFDMTEEQPKDPEAIVMPENPKDVQGILKIANEYKIPVTPYVSAANIGGLTIPLHGGIVVDLKRMNRVIKADEKNKYVIVEPGVTFGRLKAYLDKNHPDYMYSYAFSPPHTSVMANALLEGLTEYSYRYGCMGEFIVGLEVVLPTGEITRIGNCALMKHDNWNQKYPLPDMSSLFIGWQGMTGIVTKISVKLIARPPILEKRMLIFFNRQDMCKMLPDLARTELIQGDFTFSFETVLMMLGAKHPIRELKESDPESVTGIYFFAYSEKEKKAKEKVLQKMCTENSTNAKRPITMVPLELGGDKYKDILDLPRPLPNFMEFRSGIKTDPDQIGAGMSWLGTFCPISSLQLGYEKGYDIMKKHGFAPLIFSKLMDSGHFIVMRYLIPFQKPKDNQAVRELLEELVDFAIDEVGAIPYKCPAWAAKKVLKRLDPNWVALARRIRGTLDPNKIMNPGRWNL